MTDTSESGPITNQEINAAANRIAHDIVAYALSEIRDLLPDGCIGETIADDQDANRLDTQARGIVYGLVWDRLGGAAADYQCRDQVLTEAAHLLYKADYDAHFISLCCKDCAMESAAGVLLAARTAAGPANPDELVRCSGPHCPNGERRHLAAGRAWQRGDADTWHCPKCAAASSALEG